MIEDPWNFDWNKWILSLLVLKMSGTLAGRPKIDLKQSTHILKYSSSHKMPVLLKSLADIHNAVVSILRSASTFECFTALEILRQC